MQQILNIAKIKDSDCNSLTVEVGSKVADDKFKKTQVKPKRKRKQDKEIKKCQERKKNSKTILKLTQKN